MIAHPSPIPDLIHALASAGVDVRADLPTRVLYSTDASIYQVQPQAVAAPRHTDELQAVMEACARLGVSVTARGAGSSLGGQAIGPGLMVDCSRLNRILALDPNQRTATVEPGVVLNALNRQAGSHGLQFGPDPASAERATLGGSLGNNAAGAHSIRYGMFIDHILSADVVLWDGGRAVLGPIDATRLTSQVEAGGDSSEGAWLRAVADIRRDYAQAIRDGWPCTWRRASGYALNYLLPWSPDAPPYWGRYNAHSHNDDRMHPYDFTGETSGVGRWINLAHLLGGAEGTLALVQRMQLRLVPVPSTARLVVIAFPDMVSASAFTPQALAWEPAAVELIPGVLVKLARTVPAYAAQLTLLGQLAPAGAEPPALLVLEFSGDEAAAVDAQARMAAEQAQATRPVSTVTLLVDRAAQQQVWLIRKVGLGLIMSRPSDQRPYSFVEDMAVPVERLAEFVGEMQRLLAQHGVVGEIYGHASAGCLHIRPILNLKTSEGVARLRAISSAAAELTFRLGGSMSGEHGDGLARSEWYLPMFGPEIVEAFRLLKRAADPHDLLNPGKMVSASEATPIGRLDENLRFGVDYRAAAWQPVMHFAGESGLATAIEQCNGAGVCRKAEGLMCPSFQATREEMHSTRGRANLLRWLISGGADQAEAAAFEALDLCLACKGCKAECPSGVDVAKLKYEFMHAYYQRHTRKLRDYLFGYIHVIGRLTHGLAGLINPLLKTRWFRRLFEAALGVSAQRRFPEFSGRGLDQLMRVVNTPIVNSKTSINQPAKTQKVIYLSDPFTEYMQPAVGLAGVGLLRAAGCQVARLPIVGAGRTLISKGFLPAAKAHAARLMRAVAKLDPEGILPVVGVEPSEVHALLDEYLDFFPDDVQALALSKRAWTVEEFLLRPGENGAARWQTLLEGAGGDLAGLATDGKCEADDAATPVLLHGHCYQKARPAADDGLPVGVQASALLLQALGCQVSVVDDGCCGMAGAFGYEQEHYDLSMKVGELALFPAVRAAAGGVLVAAAGVSCREQIGDGTGRTALHPVQIAMRLITRCPPDAMNQVSLSAEAGGSDKRG